MFRKIFQSFGFPQHQTTESFTLPLGLTQSDWLALQRLVKSEDFAVLQKTLDNVINSYGEHILATEETEKIHFLRGKIVGLRYALEIVDEIHKKEQDFLVNERRRADTRATPVGKRKLSTFGTPAWNGTKHGNS